MHDLGTHHLTSLRLHAMNREQYPRFYRGRYRLAMSLEVAASPGLTFTNPEAVRYMTAETLAILSRCGLPTRATCLPADIVPSQDVRGQYRLSEALSQELLRAAQAEIRVIKRQLLLPAVLWAAARHRDERTVWRPYRSLRVRQSFRDGASVAQLLFAVRMILNDPAQRSRMRLGAYRQALRISAAIAGDVSPVQAVLWGRARDGAATAAAAVLGTAMLGATGPAMAAGVDATTWSAAGDGVRLLPWARKTASWQAAYNAACLYSALTQRHLASDDLVVRCLRRAIDSPDTEMERAYDWIAYDPDFRPLKNSPAGQFPAFKKFLRDQKHKDYPRGLRAVDVDDRDEDQAEGGDPGDAAGPDGASREQP
jgi:hypothetical protein